MARFHSGAQREFYRALEFYGEQSSSAAPRLWREVNAVVGRITVFPRHGKPHVLDTRMVVLSAFPYSVVYIIRNDRPFIIAVAHHSRRPDYWIKRLRT